MNKLKLAAVSYLNTKPLIYGIEHHPVKNQIDLQLAIPALCAEKLYNGEVDVALMPVGALHELDDYSIVSDFCIGTEGTVRTVCIFSDTPLEAVNTLFLDNHSRTSVLLVKYLLENYWKVDVTFATGYEGFEQSLKSNEAGLVIGDKVFPIEHKYRYIYDLGEAWVQMTGLPFVFAAWVANKPVDTEFLTMFNAAQQWGINHIDELLESWGLAYPNVNLKNYYDQNISFDLNAKKMQGLELFLSKSISYTDSISI